MIAKCSREQLGEFLEDIMKKDKQIEFFISDEESMSEKIEDDVV
ncbi:hypothetical protein [Clostridium sp.]|nr:hypothetical protein [Clostridium sp.]MDU5107776.1 hypothetical protein [Clostridium sp.]